MPHLNWVQELNLVKAVALGVFTTLGPFCSSLILCNKMLAKLVLDHNCLEGQTWSWFHFGLYSLSKWQTDLLLSTPPCGPELYHEIRYHILKKVVLLQHLHSLMPPEDYYKGQQIAFGISCRQGTVISYYLRLPYTLICDFLVFWFSPILEMVITLKLHHYLFIMPTKV